MKLWLATTLAAILLSVCSAYPWQNSFEITPGANNAEDQTRQTDMQDFRPDVIEQLYDTGVMDYPEVQALSSTTCLHDFYILGFTSGLNRADSDTAHEVEVRAAGQTRVIKLPNLPGGDYQKNRGDLWKLTFSGDLKFTGCVTLKNIDHVAIESGGNDGWNIDSIVTYVGVSGRFRELTRNFNAFRWIDGDGPSSHRRFVLRNVH